MEGVTLRHHTTDTFSRPKAQATCEDDGVGVAQPTTKRRDGVEGGLHPHLIEANRSEGYRAAF